MGEPRALPRDYPPAEHVLRDLRLWSDPAAEPPAAGLPVQAALAGRGGACSAGALAVLVDVVAGAAALRSAGSDWIATSDLRVHWLRPVAAGELVARAEPLRSGRTSIVIEVAVEAAGARVARGAVGFSRLPATGEYQTQPREPGVARIEWGAGSQGFARPWSERIGAVVRDAAAGVVELSLGPYVGNSLGGLQGGIGVALLDLAAEAAASARLGPAVATRDLAVHFLALGRAGPLRTRVELLRQDGDAVLLRVESRDTGAGDRLCALASATVGAPLS
jgi:uncharacterized protein (TIGR00369 family)